MSELFGVDRPSVRTNPNTFFDKIKQIGEITNKNFTKKDGSVDIKKFNRFVKSQGINPLDKTPRGIIRLNSFMNSLLPKGEGYKLVAVDTPGKGQKFKSAETTIKQEPGTIGAKENKQIYDEGQKLNKKALKKFPNSRADRLKFIVDGLYNKFNKFKGVTKKYLTQFVKGGFKTSPIGLMSEFAMDMIEQNPELMSLNPFMQGEPQVYEGGGMANIFDMTKPVGFTNGGFAERMKMLRETMRDSEEQRMKAPDVTGVALRIARQQGDTSEDNVNLIIKQLNALLPSLTQTMEQELTPTSTRGIESLRNRMLEMMGKKSSPAQNRSVGFGRVE